MSDNIEKMLRKQSQPLRVLDKAAEQEMQFMRYRAPFGSKPDPSGQVIKTLADFRRQGNILRRAMENATTALARKNVNPAMMESSATELFTIHSKVKALREAAARLLKGAREEFGPSMTQMIKKNASRLGDILSREDKATGLIPKRFIGGVTISPDIDFIKRMQEMAAEDKMRAGGA